MEDQEYNHLKGQILKLTGIDLSDYKSQQMRRRLDGFLARFPGSGVVPYCQMLERDPAALQRLTDFLTINVSEFFRDAEQFQVFRTRILPELLRSSPSLRIWSAGCSIGAEPYSLAMILEECWPQGDYRILATDLDQQVLVKARAGGPYTEADVKNVSKDLLLKYFARSGADYQVVDRLKKKIVFRQHNMLKDPFERDFDLIVCRNVVIYFTDEAKAQLNQEFRNSLKDKGVLFIGGTETLLDAQDLGLQRLHASFYGKVSAPRRESPARPGAKRETVVESRR
ncbi:MAG: CheR family methyltransferase [Dehalococcoidia bacterium]